VCKIDEFGFTLNNRLPKMVNKKGKCQAVLLKKVKMGQNIAIGASASEIYIQGVTGGKDQTSGGCSLC